MGKFGSVKMSIVFDYDLDEYANGNEWEREALVDMVKDVFLDDIYNIANEQGHSWIIVEEVQ